MTTAAAPEQAQAAAASTALNPRLAPQALDAERSVLGGILLTNEALYDIAEIVVPGDFYRQAHVAIFESMSALAQRNDPIDVITLSEELRSKGQLEQAGGVAYLASLDTAVPATGNLVKYAKIVAEKAQARRVIEAAHTIARDGYDLRGPVVDFCDSAAARMFLATERRGEGDFKKTFDLTRTVFEQVEALYERGDDLTGVPSGFHALDRMTAGLQKQDLIIVAGRPSMGKTTVVMNIAAHVAIEHKLPVAVFSLEMSSESLVSRMLACEARVNAMRLRTGKLVDTDWPKLARAADRIARAPLYIDDQPGLSPVQMRAKCRRLKAQLGKLGLVVVDYLQLMELLDADSREQEISGITRSLKRLAKELDVPLIALSQLNRNLERRDDKRPVMSDLRESGGIEQDADLIAFIYRDEVYNKESPEKGIAEIIIGKQRNGAIGTVRVAFIGEYTRFENLANQDEGGGFRG